MSRISLFYFKYISQRRITLIRKQGIGDVIFSTGVIARFKESYPSTKVKLVVSHPSCFEEKVHSNFSLLDFPCVWVMYEHFDFALLRKGDKHISRIMADFLSLQPDVNLNYKVPFKKPPFNKGEEGLVVIHPQAGGWNTGRNWSLKKWEQLVHKLRNHGFEVCQIGIKDDSLIPLAIDFRGKLDIQESFGLIKQADVFVGVNSFAEQAAAAFGIQSVIIYGPTNPIYSLNPNQVAVYGKDYVEWGSLNTLHYDFPLTESIDVETVYSAVIKMLHRK